MLTAMLCVLDYNETPWAVGYTRISLIGCVASIERTHQLSVVRPMTC